MGTNKHGLLHADSVVPCLSLPGPQPGQMVSNVPSTSETLQYGSHTYSGASALIWGMQQRGPDWSKELRVVRGKRGTKNSRPDGVIRAQMVRDGT